MRIFISALLLALFGNKRDTKCIGEQELTNSYIPAGIQVLNHYLTQIRGAYENEAGKNVRGKSTASPPTGARQWNKRQCMIKLTLNLTKASIVKVFNPVLVMVATSPFPQVPTIVINYQTVNTAESRTIKRLEKLALALDGEANEQGLGDCKGFGAEVLRQLEKSSKLTSSGQLSFILKSISKEELKRPITKILVKGILMELEDEDSELYRSLTLVAPLKYLSDASLE